MVQPKEQVKILGIVMDSQLRFKQHIARAATRGLKAALALKRLRGLSPATARQLYVATVAPVMDYASSIWMHACGTTAGRSINRVQRVGAQAIIRSFSTVATAVAEAEAGILPARERFVKKATKLWIDRHTLPANHPIRRLSTRTFRRFVSPLQKIAALNQGTPTDRMETIYPFTLGPWEKRLEITVEPDGEAAAEVANAEWAVRIATSSSARNALVGMGGAIQLSVPCRPNITPETFSVTLGPRTEQNPYVAELAAMAWALEVLPANLVLSTITLLSSNKAAIQAVGQPRQQSGQQEIRNIYKVVDTLAHLGNAVRLVWIPAGTEYEITRAAKAAARQSTLKGKAPNGQPTRTRSTTLGTSEAARRTRYKLPDEVGKFSKKVDSALPGKHTRQLYDILSWKEASILSQLRTGMARLNGYLYRIGVVTSNECPCGEAEETVEHFLFRCTKWTGQRTQLLQCSDTRRGNLSYYLGGKGASDSEKWAPDTEAVRATVRFTMKTGRLDTQVE